MRRVPKFRKTRRQVRALDVLNNHRHGLLYGGARSGKTFIIIRNIILRAMKKRSKHLVTRLRFNHARTSLGHETIPDVLRICFPGLPIIENKADNFWTIPTASGEQSELWIGGTDDKERVEKILGNQYSTIYVNECSQVPFEAITILWTRLAENSGLEQRFYYDCNPPGKKHWTNKLFHKGVLPDDTPHNLDVGSLSVNPGHNRVNLSPEYLESLESLPRRQRLRFLLGKYLDDVEGALWTDEMIVKALAKEYGTFRKTVVGVDPSVTNKTGSDECGIVVASMDEDREGVIRKDLSKKCSTRRWAQRVVTAYHVYEANEVVAEVNQGGDLVEDAIHNIDPNVKVVKVHASQGKLARAEPVSMLYEQGKVAHAEDFPDLQAELTETDLSEVKASPNRLDAAVWALTRLMVKKSGARIHVGSV